MANNTLNARLIFCNDTTANWGSSTKVLLKGEVGIEFPETGAPKFKVGDGVNTWEDLSYCFLTPAEIEALIAAANHTHANKEILDAIEVALTADMKSKYETAYTHSQSQHAPAVAEENVINTVKVNGVSQSVTDKAVDITVPTKVSDLLNDEGYIKEYIDTQYEVSASASSDGSSASIDLKTKGGVSAGSVGIKADGAASVSVVGNDITISTEQYDDTELAGKVASNTAAINTLNGTGDGSVKKAIDDEFNAFAAKVSDDGVVNTYKELVDYAATHSAEFTELVGVVSTNEAALNALKELVGTIPEGASAQTVIDFVLEKVNAVDFTSQIATAKQEAISAAESDATTKANTAEQNAKDYADGLAGNYATAAQGERADKAVTKVSINGTEVTKNAAGEVDITGISTDLLVEGTNTLILSGGSASDV